MVTFWIDISEQYQPPSLTREDLLTRFRDYLQYERRYSIHTLEGYIRDSRQFSDFLSAQFAIENIATVNHHHIRSWVVSLLQKKNQSVSVRRKFSAYRNGLILFLQQTDHPAADMMMIDRCNVFNCKLCRKEIRKLPAIPDVPF